jgi:hypothetical protein
MNDTFKQVINDIRAALMAQLEQIGRKISKLENRQQSQSALSQPPSGDERKQMQSIIDF